MYNYQTSVQFLKGGNHIFNKDEIAALDYSDIENLKVRVILKSKIEFIVEDIQALELMMQLKPSAIEGKRLIWPKFVWFVHNMFGHPLTQIFALIKCYKIAFWIHDVTVPKPIGAKRKKEI